MIKLGNVLSLFDGMSCGQLALDKLGYTYDNYFASEIDKYSMSVTRKNFPNTKYLGDVRFIESKDLPEIDLLIGGSPCQNFSFSGTRKGMTTTSDEEILTLEQYLELKGNGFEFEGESYLFWEYVRLLKEINPKYFLLENVMMAKKWENLISEVLNIEPVMINSSKVSAQNRKRLYWTNIPQISQPDDKKLVLKDILEESVDEKYYLSEKVYESNIKHLLRHKERGNGFGFNPSDKNGKSNAISTKEGGRQTSTYLDERKDSPNMIGGVGDRKWGDSYPQGRRVYSTNGKSVTLSGAGGGNEEKTGLYLDERKIIKHDIPQQVEVRKYEVDVPKLQECLKSHKNMSMKELSEKLNIPKTQVEHYFRTDSYFAIPDKDIWLNLKELLNIKTGEFDESILEFEIRDGVFEKSNRVYDSEGLAPTLTSTNADEKIIVPLDKHNSKDGIKCVGGIDNNKKWLDDGKNLQRNFSQGERIYSDEGKSPTLSANSGGTAGKGNTLITNEPFAFSSSGGGDRPRSEAQTITRTDGKTFTLLKNPEKTNVISDGKVGIRRLTPLECERLQTVPDNYTKHGIDENGNDVDVSDTQRYKMLGNGWTVDVIAHIFGHLDPKNRKFGKFW